MALAQPAYNPQQKPRIQNPRTARNATQKRIVKTNRARYGALVRVGAVLALVLLRPVPVQVVQEAAEEVVVAVPDAA